MCGSFQVALDVWIHLSRLKPIWSSWSFLLYAVLEVQVITLLLCRHSRRKPVSHAWKSFSKTICWPLEIRLWNFLRTVAVQNWVRSVMTSLWKNVCYTALFVYIHHLFSIGIEDNFYHLHLLPPGEKILPSVLLALLDSLGTWILYPTHIAFKSVLIKKTSFNKIPRNLLASLKNFRIAHFWVFIFAQSSLKQLQRIRGSRVVFEDSVAVCSQKDPNYHFRSVFVSKSIFWNKESLPVFDYPQKPLSRRLQIQPLFHNSCRFFIFAHATHWVAWAFSEARNGPHSV